MSNDDNSDNEYEYENLHPHDYEGQETERREILDEHGPALALSHSIHYMSMRLYHNSKENPHRGLPIVNEYLKKYADDLQLHDYLSNVSYVKNRGGNGSQAETRDHFEIIRTNVNAMHQVVHYNLGKDHPITQGIARDAERINHHINMFQWSSQMDEG